jgi:hypothetical protein
MEMAGMRKKYAKVVLVMLILTIVYFVGLRYNTGADFTGYYNMFKRSLSFMKRKTITDIEYGYLLSNRIFRYVSDNYYIYQCLVTAFTCFGVYKLITRYSAYPIASLLLFVVFFFNSLLMAQMRQSIAVAIIALGTKYIFRRELPQFLVIIALAAAFHISAVLALPLYFMTAHFNKPLSILMVICSLIFYIKGGIVLAIMSLVGPLLPGRLSFIVIRYLESQHYAGQAEFSTGIYFIANLTLTLFLLACVKVKHNDVRMSFFMNTIAVSAVINNVSTGMIIIDRLRAYYLIYGIIGYTWIFKIISFKRLKEVFVLYVCLILAFFTVPYIRSRMDNSISSTTGKPMNYSFIPYYNALYHPVSAEYRK